MSPHTDLAGLVVWGLRKYAWLVVLFVVVLGVVVPATLDRVPEEYEASAQVGPVRPLRVQNLDVLPRMATDVFESIPGSPEVIAAAGVDAEALTSDQLELVAGQDNIIFSVIARGPSPEAARDTANVAATSFVRELNVYSQPVGSFAVTRLASAPTDPTPRLSWPVSLVLGLAAGLLAGIGTVLLLLLLHRPVIDVATVARLSGVPVLGRITPGRRRGSFNGMTSVCQRVLSQPTGMVLMVGAPDTERVRQELALELGSWLSRVRRVVPMGSREPVDAYGTASLALPGYSDVLYVLADASPVEVATRPERSLTLLVLREGISTPALLEQVQQYVDGGSCAAVLVRPASRLTRLRRLHRHEPPAPVRRSLASPDPAPVADPEVPTSEGASSPVPTDAEGHRSNP